MNEHWVWLAPLAMLASIQTGGGAGVDGDVRAGRDYVGHDAIYTADRDTWRELVARDLEDRRDAEQRLHNWIMLQMLIMIVLFLSMALVTALAVRRFDQMDARITGNEKALLIEQLRRYPFPTPP